MKTITDAGRYPTAARMFNSAVAGWAIGAAWELGALDELNEHGTIDAEEFAASHRLDASATLAMFRALAAVDIVRRDHTKVMTSIHFDEVFQTRSFFHWLSRGSAELFREMPSVLRADNRVGQYYRRDAAAIAFACREINTRCYDAHFWSCVDGLGFEPASVADLGCGSGERLIQLLARFPGATGAGVDIAPDSLAVARADAERAGLAGRLSFVQADVLTMSPRTEFADVELLTCFMMGHDFWPRAECIRTLARLRDVFPRARRFLIGDATRTVDIADNRLPVFTLGFEVAHDLMDTYIPTVAEWETTFEPAGWRLRRRHDIDLLVGEQIFELERL
ncbi:class I SAM-dependent methyltransferase [Actinophytocola sp. KF-1]